VSGTETGAGPAGEPAAAAFDPTVASSARIYDYWLGGKDNFAADREAAEQAIAANPGAIRQFLDIGTGLPTATNTHEGS
jgi:hypothetical protein